MKRNSTIFFDCFGTLFSNPGSVNINQILDKISEIKMDDKEFLAKLWSQCYKETEIHSQRYNREFSMNDIVYNMNSLCAKYDLTLYQKIKDLYMEQWIKKVFLFSDIREVLCKLSKSYYLGIISNTHDSKLIPDLLAKYSIDSYFSFLIFSIDVGVKKPSTQIFDYAKKMCGNKILYYIGDDFFCDIDGAQKNGIIPIYINRKNEKIEGVSSIQVMTELLDII